MLLGQTLLPGALLLSRVHADEIKTAQAVKATEQTAVPAWARDVEKRAGAEKRANRLRLAQLTTTDQETTTAVETEGADDDECLDCEVDVRALDLTHVPTEKELRRAGGLGGALNPLGRAEPGELGFQLDRLLKSANIENGLRGELPPRHPHFSALKRAKERYERARAINMDFGQAIQQWNEHNYSQAAQMFKKHLKDYPNSPWAGEAALHLGCDAKYNGRFNEAQQIYSDLYGATSEQPNPDLKERKLARRANNGGEPEARRNAQIERATQGAQSLEEAVAKLDAPEAGDDESFELHQKAKLRWADLDLAMGHFADAGQKLGNIIQTDTDWRRRTWARYWLQTSQFYLKKAPQMMACGPRALGLVLASLNKDAAAQQVRAAKAPRPQGFSLAELKELAAKNGVAMRGFKGDVAELAKLPLPAILHYDFGKEKAAPALDERGASPFHLTGSGHFVVLQKVDAKRGIVSLFDPLEQRPYQLSFAQLKEQWSGQGLALATGKTRVASAQMDAKAMKEAIGGCCGIASKADNIGDSINNDKGCNCESCGCGHGSPVVQFNRASLNMYVHDTPLWYSPPKGPAVEITMSYNSLDATTQNTAFGNKWMFNYGSYAVEDTAANGGRISVIMPDGSTDNYTPNGSSYVAEAGNFTILTRPAANQYVLTFQDGSRWFYNRPAGTSSLQSYVTRMEDRWGYALIFGYDSQVHLTTITDAVGKVTTLTYLNNRITRVTDPFGRMANFTYQGSNLLGVTDMVGQGFSYNYDADKYITQLNTAQGNWQFKHEKPDAVYNSSYNVGYYPPFNAPHMWDNIRITITNPLNEKEEYYWDGYGGRSWHVARAQYSATYPNNSLPQSGNAPNRTQYYFTLNASSKARISQIQYPDGTSETYGYNTSVDAINSVTDRRGKITTLTHNSQGQVTSVTDPKSNVTRINYYANGLDVSSVVNANTTTVMTATYNTKHQPLTITDQSNNGVTTFTYKDWGAPSTTTDAQGTGTRNLFNSAGWVGSAQYSNAPATPGGSRSWKTVGGFTYDTIGRLKTATDAASLTTTYEYDDLDRITAMVYPDSTRAEVTYLNERPATVKDRSGRISYYDYDNLKRLTKMTDAQNNVLQMGYDGNGNMNRLTDAKNNVTKWNYDALNRATRKEYQLYQGNISYETYAYTGGLLSQTRGTRGQIISYGYDDNGNPTLTDYPNMTDVTMSYNALDDVEQITDRIGTHNFVYDNYGRLTSNDGALINDTQTYSYDALQRIETQTVQRGASGGVQSQSYTYDALGRLQNINSNGTQGTGVSDYDYQGDTNRVLRRMLPNGNESTRGYDSLGRLVRISNPANGAANYNRYDYSYNTRDVVTQVTAHTGTGTPPAITTAFTYDAIDQLKQEAVSTTLANVPYTANYNYDAMGNRTTTTNSNSSAATNTYATNALNQVTGITTSYAGKPGPFPSVGFVYDDAGNLTRTNGSDGSYTLFGYDDLDRLIIIDHRDTAGTPTTGTNFYYDYANRLVTTVELSWARVQWQIDSEKLHIYDGMDVVQERDRYNNVSAQLVRDGNIGGILSRTTAAGATFYDYDGNGNVTLLTDSAGNDVGHYRYDAFGNTLEATGPRAAENPWRFSTKELHGGWYNFGFRFYAPDIGRWINRDPIDEGGGTNLYLMVGNNPVSWADAYGLSPNDPYLTQVGDVFKGYGDVLNPVNMYKGAKNIYEVGRNQGAGAAASTFGVGVWHGLTDWTTTSDARHFGQSFGTTLVIAAPVIKRIPNPTPLAIEGPWLTPKGGPITGATLAKVTWRGKQVGRLDVGKLDHTNTMPPEMVGKVRPHLHRRGPGGISKQWPYDSGTRNWNCPWWSK